MKMGTAETRRLVYRCNEVSNRRTIQIETDKPMEKGGRQYETEGRARKRGVMTGRTREEECHWGVGKSKLEK